jgi:hypothetical protein
MTLYKVSQFNSTDDQSMAIIRQDVSGGINNRVAGNAIKENQMLVMYNVDIGTPGETSRRPGSVITGNDTGEDDTIMALLAFVIQGGTDNLIRMHGQKLERWAQAGNWINIKNDFTAGATEIGLCACKESGLSPDDVFIVQDGVNNPWRIAAASWATQDLGNTAGTGSDSPPKSTVMCWYANRLWVLKNDLLYPSDAYTPDYATAFDTTGMSFRVPVGPERGLIATRDTGIIVLGRDQIWGIMPSIIPAPDTDKPQPIITNHGVVSKKGYANTGDDLYYFAHDGFRSLKRTQQDKLSGGPELPISYPLEDEYNRINFAYIDRLSMEYYDSKIFISVPTSATTFDTWVYFPATNGFIIIIGWAPSCWAKIKISGAEQLHYGKYGDDTVYRAWYGYTDEGTTGINGTSINYQEEGRKEDAGQPLIKKQSGSVRIETEASGNWNLTVYVSFDDGDYIPIGTINLANVSPTLPVNLPFTLSGTSIKRSVFHLDSYPAWYTMQLKIISNENTGADGIKILSRGFITFPTELRWGD